MWLKRLGFASLAALLAPTAVAASGVPDSSVAVIDTIAKRKQIKDWKAFTQALTASRMEAEVYSVEGHPGPAPTVVQAEVESIWRRLLSASPVPGDPTIYVADCSDRTAESLATGATRICWGYLRDLQTEDQLAAILGHEMSHLILGHTRSGRSRGTGFAFLQGLYDLALVASVTTGGGRAPFFATLIGANNALAVPTGWLDRANQSEELEADKLGIDLMVKAGFNASGLPEVFDLEGMSCGTPKQPTSPKLALIIDTSKRFTHPDGGKRSCSAQSYISLHYAQAYDRKSAPLPWSSRKLGAPGASFFRDADEADRIAVEAHDLRVKLLKSPNDKAARASCRALMSKAHTIASRYPRDRDLRRLDSAVALGCGDTNKAFDALVDEIGPATRTRPGQFQTLAISSMTDPSGTAKLYKSWLQEDFVKGLQNQKPTLASLIGLKSDAVDRKSEYESFACLISIPQIISAYDEFCNEVYSGSPAAWTCSHKYDIASTCPSSKYFPNARPLGPINFLISQSRWYATVLTNS